MTPESDGVANSFDPEHLKALSSAQLAVALLDESYAVAAQLNDDERARLEEQILNISWVPTDEEFAADEESREDVQQALGRISAAIVDDIGEELEPDEARAELDRRNAGHSLAAIDRIKEELKAGLQLQARTEGIDWNQGETQGSLRQICEKQERAGIACASDYVRDTALRELKHPGYRGVVLLYNARGGDQESFKLGLDALQEGARDKNLGWEEASSGLELVAGFICEETQGNYETLRDLAIDLLARMRDWSSITGYDSDYARAAAHLAVTFRDREQNLRS